MGQCSPDNPEGNGIAEQFMLVLVKTIYTGKAQGKDQKVEVKRQINIIIATGEVLAELVFQKSSKTRLPKKKIVKEAELKETKEADKCL